MFNDFPSFQHDDEDANHTEESSILDRLMALASEDRSSRDISEAVGLDPTIYRDFGGRSERDTG